MDPRRLPRRMVKNLPEDGNLDGCRAQICTSRVGAWRRIPLPLQHSTVLMAWRCPGFDGGTAPLVDVRFRCLH